MIRLLKVKSLSIGIDSERDRKRVGIEEGKRIDQGRDLGRGNRE